MNPSTRQARAIIAALAKHGVRQVVLAPGSRNAPLAIALAQAQPKLELFVRIDERTAGFTALGMAKRQHLPVAVVCTSGTAAAHLLAPAWEASEAGVPLILITADRPPAMRGRGANQTIWQPGMFGEAVRAEWDLPLAADRNEGYWELAVANAVTAALGDAFTAPGAVHLNLPFGEPLVPDATDDASWAAAIQPGPALPLPPGPEVLLEPLLAGAPSAPRGVLVVSDPHSAAAAIALAMQLGWPVLAEPGSSARHPDFAVQHYGRLLADPAAAERLRPDVVVTAGRFGLHRSVAAFVRSAPLHIAVGRFPLDADPFKTAAHHVPTLPVATGVAPAPAEWLAAWRAADAEFAATLPQWSAARATATLLAATGPRDLVWVAASQAVRLVDELAPPRADEPMMLVNRGTNGIDGLVAAATGAALVHGAGRSFLLVGDVAMLHDLSSLVLPRGERRPDLTLVVLDNNGGEIFRGLEQGRPEHAAVFDQVFLTPHDHDLAAIASAAGWPAVRVASVAEMVAALDGPARVIVAAVPTQDAPSA